MAQCNTSQLLINKQQNIFYIPLVGYEKLSKQNIISRSIQKKDSEIFRRQGGKK